MLEGATLRVRELGSEGSRFGVWEENVLVRARSAKDMTAILA